MATERKANFKALLNGFNRMRPASGSNLIRIADCLLNGFESKHRKNRKFQETAADDFNLLDTLQISGEEVRHSMMLAWLLNREATHAQGNLGFRLFLKHVGLNGEYAETPYQVVRERSGTESRIDVEVAARGEFIIHVENKIFSDEGDKQTAREGIDLQRRARELGAKLVNVHGFYLTLDGHKPANSEFKAISWRQIATVLDEFAERARAEQVILFASRYARALRRMAFELTQTNEDENEEQSET